MPKITFIDAAGAQRTVEAKNGMTVMETAVKNNIPGIDADCGGACACATCHVYVKAEYLDRVGKPSAMEQSMLDSRSRTILRACRLRPPKASTELTVSARALRQAGKLLPGAFRRHRAR